MAAAILTTATVARKDYTPVCLFFTPLPTARAWARSDFSLVALVRIFARRACRWCSTLERGLIQDISNSTRQILLGLSASKTTTACEWRHSKRDNTRPWMGFSLTLNFVMTILAPFHEVVSPWTFPEIFHTEVLQLVPINSAESLLRRTIAMRFTLLSKIDVPCDQGSAFLSKRKTIPAILSRLPYHF